MKRTYQGWAITGKDFGLYVGWTLTRADAIAGHVSAFDLSLREYAIGGKLSPQQQREWERCKRRGDRAVKVSISYEVPE